MQVRGPQSPTKNGNYEFIISKHRAWTESRQAKEASRVKNSQKGQIWGLGMLS